MKLSETPKMAKRIATFKEHQANATLKGLEIHGSVNGPYVYCPTQKVIGRYRSAEYLKAVSAT